MPDNARDGAKDQTHPDDGSGYVSDVLIGDRTIDDRHTDDGSPSKPGT